MNQAAGTIAAETLYEFSAPLLDGRMVSLSEWRGRVLLIVNTASLCVFTPQYEGLEALYSSYRERGLEVLSFTSNQFGKQEPGTSAEIGTFCQRNYGVSFPVFSKIDVIGPEAHPLYRFLRSKKPGTFGWLTNGRIGWNFTKFLVDREGKVVGRYGSSRSPKSLGPAIERLLNR